MLNIIHGTQLIVIDWRAGIMNVEQELKPGSLCKIKDIHEHYYSQKYGNRIVVLIKFFKGIGKSNGLGDQINVHRMGDTWLFYSIEKGTFAQLIPDCFEVYENKKERIN